MRKLRDFFFRKTKKEFKEINKGNIKAFLQQISKEIDQSFSGQESTALEELLEKELQHWLNKTVFSGSSLDPNAVKLGICLGLKETLRKINEAEELEKAPKYIA